MHSGYQSAGAVVDVTLAGTEANVQLLDDSKFRSYERGEQYQYCGGHYAKSPVRLVIPSSGRWHLAIDLGGYADEVRSAVRILRSSRA